MPERYPDRQTDRDRWIMDRRQTVGRASDLDVFRPSHWLREAEPAPEGGMASILTIFLTNRECPWRCLMCDLWRHTLEETVPLGAIPRQIDYAVASDRKNQSWTAPDWLKLYNAGSFFDPRAIPKADWDAIAQHGRTARRVIVESHPSLIGDTVLPFRDLLGQDTRLEVAMGLETANPDVLEKLNKRITLDGFAKAAGFLKTHGMDLRVFVLVKPPFLNETEALHWACRSTEFAFDCGADVVSLIPTRAGNGAMEALAQAGDFGPPRLDTLEAALRHGIGLRRGRVFADTWDLERFSSDSEEINACRKRLELLNRHQSAA